MYFPASVFLNHHFSTSSETVSLRVFTRAQLGFSISSLRQTRPCIWELQPWFIILKRDLIWTQPSRRAPLDFLVSCNERLLLLDIDSCVQSMSSAICLDSRILLHFFLVLTVFVKSLTLLLKAQRCLFLWLVLVHWSNGASSGSAACIRWLLFFLRRDESLGWCHTSGLLP